MGAKIVAHEYVKEYYQSGRAFQDLSDRKGRVKGLYDNVKLYPPDITVKDKLTLKVGERVFEIISVAPAHTNNDLIVYMPKEKIIFVGDLVMFTRIPSLNDSSSNSKGWVKTLEDMKNWT